MNKLLSFPRLSAKKITFHKGKSLFVVLPIAIMFGILVFASSQAKNLITVAHNAIFSPIQGQNEIIELTKSSNVRIQDILNSTTATGYTPTDLDTVSLIQNVEKADLIKTLPLENVRSNDLFSNKTFTLDTLAGLDPSFSKLYTNENFTYIEGQPIPIILNANDFVEVYEDWGEKNEIILTFSSNSTPEGNIQGPVKARAIPYSRDELIGKTFTIQLGGLQELQTFKQETTTAGIKYTKKTTKELTDEEAARKKSISKYWDYTKISEPLSYTFIVAGISEGTDKTAAYVPTDFASIVMKEYLSLSSSSRNKTAMPSTDYNLTYVGLVYDGVSLQKDATTTLFAGVRNSVTDQVKSQFNNINKDIATQNSKIASSNRQIDSANRTMGRPPGELHFGGSAGLIDRIGSIGSLDAGKVKINFPTGAASYTIPGLVYKKDRTTSNLTGEFSSFDFTKALPINSTTILIKLSSIDAREQAVTDLNAKGFNYTDFSKYKQFDTLEKYIYLILQVASAIFLAITGLFVLINMSKFVSESRKEIGIFRAMGATKGDIRSMFTQQSLVYILLAIVIGGAIGVLGVIGSGTIMVQTAQSFMTSTLGSSIILSSGLKSSDFITLDIVSLGLYVAGLIVITLFVSLIPAHQAAKISPVEAIRNN